jgi:nicotinamidase-related amidase
MNTALLIMDVQPGIIDRISNKEAYLAKAASVIAFAREQKIPVIFVVVGFREGYPEVSAHNKTFSALQQANPAFLVNPKPVFPVAENDVLVTKRRVSAFAGSDLEVVLRSKQIQHIVLAGLSTSGVVLSTLREAADKDYQITVLSDVCADTDEQLHDVLMQKVFPRQADVTESAAWMKM